MEMRGNLTESAQSLREIPFDKNRESFLAELYEEYYSARLYNPLQHPDKTDQLIAQMNTWRSQPSPVSVVLTAGVYDLLHLNHAAYMLHTKAAGAARHYETYYASRGTWENLDQEARESWTRTFLANDELKLIVSVDGDASVAASKGFNPLKGTSVRPIFSWDTRARMIANIHLPLPHTEGISAARTVADAVTIHGPEEFDTDSPHHGIVELAAHLQPDTWAIYGESLDTLKAAATCKALGNVALTCIPYVEDSAYFKDELLGGRFSTTKIVQRARGEI